MSIPGRPVADKKVIVIIWIAMVIACIIYWVIADYFLSFLPDDMEAYKIIRIPIAIVGIVTILTGIYFGWVRSRPLDDERSGDYIHRALPSLIVCMACFEGVAICGLAIRFMGEPSAHRIFIGVGFVLMLIAGSRIGPVYSHIDTMSEMEDSGRF